MSATRPPLVVDLDGSLLRCDLLHDALAGLAIRSPLLVAGLAWTHRGNLPRFKTAIAKVAPIVSADLPYTTSVLDHVRTEAATGRRVILATASPNSWARSVAHHLGCFSDVIATTETVNFKGPRKLAAIKELLGPCKFSYIGDSPADLPIFHAATECLLVGAAPRVKASLARGHINCVELAPRSPKSDIGALWQLCRPHHWVKNLLLFLTAFTGIGLYEPRHVLHVLAIFLAMSAVASAVYILNDLADISADRAHAEKRRRPLAAGTVSVPMALKLAMVLTIGGLTLAACLNLAAAGLLLGYLTLNAIYTTHLKEMPLADVCALTLFYLFRVVLGAVVLGVNPTVWFLAFLACIFMELAIWKRYVEILRSPDEKLGRRGYYRSDAGVMLSFGVGFSFCAALILGMYTQSNNISPVYQAPALLTLLAPILLLHNLGMWLDGSRGHSSGDPILRVLHSKKSWAAGVTGALVIAAARLGFQ
jgi:4-hydroxybenzoate polyprenyltransferase